MAFESLSEKLQNIFKNLRGKGRLSEADVKEAMREVKMALLAADVNFKVVKKFVSAVQERAVGQEVMNGLNPGQMVIKIVNEEMIALMGGEAAELPIKPGRDRTVLLMAGLQGAGKTTMAAKLGGRLEKEGKHVLLVACDIYRPAAIKQLEINGEKLGIDVFSMGDKNDPCDIVKVALSYADQNGKNVVIIDTAGRLHVDGEMMAELKRIKEVSAADVTLLTVDAMTGQDAVNAASAFDSEIGIDGVILTKLDGDTRGGAALSIRSVTGKPIYFSGTGEKLTDIEPFYPERMASRILGMGDVLSLIEKAGEQIEEDEAREIASRMQKGKFDYNDYLKQLESMRSMGGIGQIMQMLPSLGLGGAGGRRNMNMPDEDEAEKQFARVEAMIHSMTPYERTHPDVIDIRRKTRIAKGAGLRIDDVNRMVKQFGESRKMMKQMSGMMNGKRGRFRLPFGM
ncbi:MAG: signal recognition particle protein [Lachnospiraceae bacterium]|nr:signal recognition particle protein [Lachnospiraceae bacterium]